MYLYLFPCPLLLSPTLFLPAPSSSLPRLPLPPSSASLCTGSGSDSHSHSHSESGDSPSPGLCPPRHHTLSTLTASDSRCSSSSATESALLPTGEKATQAGAELKMVSQRTCLCMSIYATVVNLWVLFADS